MTAENSDVVISHNGESPDLLIQQNGENTSQQPGANSAQGQPPVNLTEAQPQYSIILACVQCSVKCRFKYANPERKPGYCIFCGRPAEEIESG